MKGWRIVGIACCLLALGWIAGPTPAQGDEPRTTPAASAQKRLTVQIDETGRLAVGHQAVSDLEALEEFLCSQAGRVEELIVQVDREAQHSRVLEVLQLAQRVGIEDVAIAAAEKEPDAAVDDRLSEASPASDSEETPGEEAEEDDEAVQEEEESVEVGPEQAWSRLMGALETAEVTVRDLLETEGTLSLDAVEEVRDALARLQNRVEDLTEEGLPFGPQDREVLVDRGERLVQSWRELVGRLRHQMEQMDSEEARRELGRLIRQAGGHLEKALGRLRARGERMKERFPERWERMFQRMRELPPPGWAEELFRRVDELTRLVEELLHREREERPGPPPGPESVAPDAYLEVFSLGHTSAWEASRVLEQLLRDRIRLGVAERTNQLFVLASPREMDFVRRILDAMETAPRPPRPKPEVRKPEVRREHPEAREPRYEYEKERPQPPKKEEEPDAAYREFRRSSGTLVDRSEELIVLETPAGERLELVVPQVQDEAGRWRVPRPLAEQLDRVKEGDRVVVEWWPTPDARYLEAIVPMGREESSLFR